MKQVNLIYENDYDNVSIILVQDEFCINLSQNVQKFLDWTYDKK